MSPVMLPTHTGYVELQNCVWLIVVCSKYVDDSQLIPLQQVAVSLSLKKGDLVVILIVFHTLHVVLHFAHSCNCGQSTLANMEIIPRPITLCVSTCACVGMHG